MRLDWGQVELIPRDRNAHSGVLKGRTDMDMLCVERMRPSIFLGQKKCSSASLQLLSFMLLFL